MSSWTDVGHDAHVRTSRAFAMNSVVLFEGDRAVVVDPGVLPSEMTEIADRISERAPRFENVTLAFTHPHWDHVLGRPWFPAARTVAHVGFADELERDAATIESKAKSWIEGEGEAWPHAFRAFTPDVTVRGTVGFRLGPFDAVAYEVPGHSSSQMALLVPGPGVFIAADMLSDIEIPWLEGPPWVYIRTLKALHWVFEQEDIRVLVPGHGPPAYGRVDAYRRLLRDLDYLLHLEARVGEAWKRGLSLQQTRAELSGMEYLGKDAPHAMNDVHHENVRFAYEGLVEMAADHGRM